MFDLNRSYFNDLKERAVASGVSITEEGMLLEYVSDGAGGIAVQPCSADSQDLAGFAITDALKVVTETVVEVITVPTPLGTVQLSHQNIVASSEYAVGSSTGAMAQGTNYSLVDATGIIDFATYTAVAGETVTIQYRYNLTLQESLDRYHERSINNRAQDYFSSVSVGCLEGEIFTSMYDTSKAYAINDPIYPEAGGLLTSTSGGAVVGKVTQVPSVNDGLLGVKFTMPIGS